MGYGIYFDDSIYINGRGYAVAGGIWFPNSGVIGSGGSFILTGENNRLSTATPFSGWSTREIRWGKTGSGYNIQQHNSSYMSAGRVVRCQME